MIVALILYREVALPCLDHLIVTTEIGALNERCGINRIECRGFCHLGLNHLGSYKFPLANLGRSEQGNELQAGASVSIVLKHPTLQVICNDEVSAFCYLANDEVRSAAVNIAACAEEMAARIFKHLTVQRVKAIALISGHNVQAIKRIGSELRTPIVALRDVLSGLSVAQEIRAVGNNRCISFHISDGHFCPVIIQLEVVEDAPSSGISSLGLDADTKRAVGHFNRHDILVLAIVECITCALTITGIGAVGNVLKKRFGTAGIQLCHDTFASSCFVETLCTKLIDTIGKTRERLMNVVVADARLLTDIVASVASPVENVARCLPFLKQSFPQSSWSVVVTREVPALYHEGCILREGVKERGRSELCKQIFLGQHLPEEHIVAILIVPVVVVVREATSVCLPREVLAKLLVVLDVLDAGEMVRFIDPTDLQRRTAIVNPAVATEPMFVHVIAREVGVQLIDPIHLLVRKALAVLAHRSHHAPVVTGLQEHSCRVVSDKVIAYGNLILGI